VDERTFQNSLPSLDLSLLSYKTSYLVILVCQKVMKAVEASSHHPSPPGSPNPSERMNLHQTTNRSTRSGNAAMSTTTIRYRKQGTKDEGTRNVYGQRDDVNLFRSTMQSVFWQQSHGNFKSEMEKQLWITSLCHGKAVEGWVDWVTSMLVDRNVEAPQSATEMLAYLKIYFGDPDEKSTARHDLDTSYKCEELKNT